MSGRIDWSRDKRLHQRIEKAKAANTKPIQSSVKERPPTAGQRARISALTSELGIDPPVPLTSRGAKYTIDSLQLRVDRQRRQRS